MFPRRNRCVSWMNREALSPMAARNPRTVAPRRRAEPFKKYFRNNRHATRCGGPMAVRVALRHHTLYQDDPKVRLLPQITCLRPAAHCRTLIETYSLKVEPKPHFINWQQNQFGNSSRPTRRNRSPHPSNEQLNERRHQVVTMCGSVCRLILTFASSREFVGADFESIAPVEASFGSITVPCALDFRLRNRDRKSGSSSPAVGPVGPDCKSLNSRGICLLRAPQVHSLFK